MRALLNLSLAIAVPVFGLVSTSDLGIIRRGGLYVERNWLDAEEVTTLQQDVANLATNYFLPSGLSNRVAGDTNSFGSADRLTCTITPELFGGENRERVENKLDTLRLRLQQELGIANLDLAEHYYSISPTGSSLPRHMDERHEETKGQKAWEAETRRSISWLLYLNDAEWNGGGELRAYCRKSSVDGCGVHEGNLQVGWLPGETEYTPVFLDSWVKTPVDNNSNNEEGELQWKPLSALYRLSKGGERDYQSDSFGPGSPSWPSNMNLDPEEFAAALASQLHHSGSFTSVESIESVSPTDVLPTGGTLVLFDSVTVPHEVLATTNGERFAMAGWFHEPTQDFPDWYGT